LVLKKKIAFTGLGMLLSIVIFTLTAFASAASFSPSDWTKNGAGTTEIAATEDGGIQFKYNLVSTSIWSGQWWVYESTAKATETFEFTWSYNWFHSWYMAQAKVYAYAYGPNGIQQITLYDNWASFDNPAKLQLTEGYKYGFKVFGQNYDGTKTARGDLTIKAAGDNIPPTATVSYSKETPTNQDVVATITASEPVTITNNGGSASYTFTGNGSFTFEFVDAAGNAGTAQANVSNIDKVAPTLEVLADVTELKIPNHKLVPVQLTWDAKDNNSGLASVTLVSVTSNEPDNGLGDGDMANDIQEADIGTADQDLLLRSERAGGGLGRIYTIVYQAVDYAGNTVTAETVVKVPHNAKKK
jgi:hypothetical protein